MFYKCFIYIVLFALLPKCQAEIYAIKFESQIYFEEFADAFAQFGPRLSDRAERGILVIADPPNGCKNLKPPHYTPSNPTGKWFLLVPRYNCSFEQKVRVAQNAGYDAVIVYNIDSDELVPMSAENGTGIYIPSVFVGETSGLALKSFATPDYYVVITGESPFNIQTHLLIPFAIVVGICFIVMIVFMIAKYIKDRRQQRRHRLPASTLNKIPTKKYQKGDPYETCAICLDDYVEGEKLRILPCNHVYHSKCIDPWLTKNKRVCPICKRKVFAQDEPHDTDSDTDTDTDDSTPLLNSTNRGTQGGTFQQPQSNPLLRAVRSISQQSGAANFVTASDHHSINGEYQTYRSNSSISSENDSMVSAENEYICDNLEVHVYDPDTTSSDSVRSVNIHVVT